MEPNYYRSTRGGGDRVSSATAIARGIAPDGGLYVPERLPRLEPDRIQALARMNYVERAEEILAGFLTDFTPEELHRCVRGAYAGGRFEEDIPARLARLGDEAYLLELWHGPTCAFKDLALQLLPQLLVESVRKTGGGETVILTATSGDTGKAALEGFRDVPGTRILVFYPRDGVSEMQRLQMVTQEGGNLDVCAVEGNFDDAQAAVKELFTDPDRIARLGRTGRSFSSANSINWGRLAPQIVYYVSAYCDLVAAEEIALGDPVNVCVPTGNFGNLLAAYYARGMGLPVANLICASNRNHVLSDFIQTGRYDRNRPFYTTTSPSMDILVSSNLERLLYSLHGADGDAVRRLMDSLRNEGSYCLPGGVAEEMRALFYGGFCDDQAAAGTIRRVFDSYGYCLDPHTAVAVEVYGQYRSGTGDRTPTVIASTASPFKFPGTVLEALGEAAADRSEFELAEALSRRSGMPLPPGLARLDSLPRRFDASCPRGGVGDYVDALLGLNAGGARSAGL